MKRKYEISHILGGDGKVSKFDQKLNSQYLNKFRAAVKAPAIRVVVTLDT